MAHVDGVDIIALSSKVPLWHSDAAEEQLVSMFKGHSLEMLGFT